MKRDDQGKYYWELRACKYWDEFEKPKIIYPDIAKRPEFAYDEEAFYLVNTLYLLPTDEKWLVNLLNSSIVFWIYTKISSKIRGGFVRFIAQYVSQIPIPNNSKKKLFSRYIQENFNNLDMLEQENDARIAHLYGLTEEEYDLILNETFMADTFRISALNLYRDIAKGKIK